MIYKTQQGEVETNLRDHSYNELNTGVWELGFIRDNPGLSDTTNNSYYYDSKDDAHKGDAKTHRSFKNKVKVQLSDGKTVEKHIIHWVKSKGYFCITNDKFWDQFDPTEIVDTSSFSVSPPHPPDDSE